jgi:hypothetical protein
VTVCLSLFIPIDYLTILSAIAIAGGLCFFVAGFQMLVRKRLLLATPTSRIRDAALGLLEVNGAAAGPYTMPAPVTGKPCFLYHARAWEQRDGKKEWEKVADETLHLPFFIADSTGRLLVEPLGADLDLRDDFREEFDASLFSQDFLSSNPDSAAVRIAAFLSRHGVAPSGRVRIEERLVEPGDALFVTGTLVENPGVQVRPLAPRNAGVHSDSAGNPAADDFSGQDSAPQTIRLDSGAAPSSAREMSQQAKIAAALRRAGIAKLEAWSAAGISRQTVALEENALPAPVSNHAELRLHEVVSRAAGPDEAQPDEDQPDFSGVNLTPPVVLMKGADDGMFAISFRSQKEFVVALAWKSAAWLAGGAAMTLLGLYTLLAQMKRL